MQYIMLNSSLTYLLWLFCICGEIAQIWSISPLVRGALEGVFYAPRLTINKLHTPSRHRGALWGERGT